MQITIQMCFQFYFQGHPKRTAQLRTNHMHPTATIVLSPVSGLKLNVE